MPTGSELRLVRVARKLSLEETARRAGIGLSTLSRLENERIPMPPHIAARLMDVLGWNEAFERLFHDLAAQEQGEQRANLEQEEVGQEAGQEAPRATPQDGQQQPQAHLDQEPQQRLSERPAGGRAKLNEDPRRVP